MFKEEWEKTAVPLLLDEGTIKYIVEKELPNYSFKTFHLISGGCANLNILLHSTEGSYYILRVYLRDEKARFREQKIADLLSGKIPVPQVLKLGEHHNLHYALVEYMPGITLREALLHHSDVDGPSLMYQAGQMLAVIAEHQFQKPGFLDEELNTVPTANIFDYIHELLSQPGIGSILGGKRGQLIQSFIDTYKHFFPDASCKNLVHGDYDPANILVHEIHGKWQISALLDWEFAFAGSWLWDISNMLRYAHKMPEWFGTQFIKGLADQGIKMPDQWNSTIRLLNCMSLLECLKNADPLTTPNKCQDILELMDYITDSL